LKHVDTPFLPFLQKYLRSIDTDPGSDREFLGRAFHLEIPTHWRRSSGTPTVRSIRQYQVDEFLGTLSYEELLGFLPDDPKADSYIFAIRQANAFRLLCEDPAVFLDGDNTWHDSQSDMIGEDNRTNHSIASAILSCSDWDLNLQANNSTTATANWVSVKHQYSEEDLQRLWPHG
jgi:hypothetical protein